MPKYYYLKGEEKVYFDPSQGTPDDIDGFYCDEDIDLGYGEHITFNEDGKMTVKKEKNIIPKGNKFYVRRG